MWTRIALTGTSSEAPPGQMLALQRLWATLQGSPELHHGDCVGVDAQAHALWLQFPGRRVVIHPPSNEFKRAWCEGGTLLPAQPFLARNRAIVDGTEVLYACPWEQEGEALRSGVWATVRYARKLGRPVALVRPGGQIELERWPQP